MNLYISIKVLFVLTNNSLKMGEDLSQNIYDLTGKVSMLTEITETHHIKSFIHCREFNLLKFWKDAQLTLVNKTIIFMASFDEFCNDLLFVSITNC